MDLQDQQLLQQHAAPVAGLGALIIILWLLSILIGILANPLSASISNLPPIQTSIEDGVGSSLRALNNIEIETLQTLGEKWSNLSASKKLFAYFNRVVPLITWINICSARTNVSSFLLASCIDRQRMELPYVPSQYAGRLLQRVANLWSFSELDAISFAKAVKGMSSSDEFLLNVFCILQLIVVLLFIAWLPKQFGLKWAFFVMLAISIVSNLIIQIASRGSYSVATANVQNIYGSGTGVLALLFGSILIWRWLQRTGIPVLAGAAQSAAKKIRFKMMRRPYDVERWNALVRFDDEISKAVEQVRPYGENMIEEMGRAYFALKEDRRYLPGIVSRLIAEGKQKAAR